MVAGRDNAARRHGHRTRRTGRLVRRTRSDLHEHPPGQWAHSGHPAGTQQAHSGQPYGTARPVRLGLAIRNGDSAVSPPQSHFGPELAVARIPRAVSF